MIDAHDVVQCTSIQGFVSFSYEEGTWATGQCYTSPSEVQDCSIITPFGPDMRILSMFITKSQTHDTTRRSLDMHTAYIFIKRSITISDSLFFVAFPSNVVTQFPNEARLWCFGRGSSSAEEARFGRPTAPRPRSVEGHGRLPQ